MKDYRGVVVVLTGDGKGKTTAALGMALRALGHDWRVAIYQFLKAGDFGEVSFSRQLMPALEWRQFGSGRFVKPGNPADEDRKLAERGWTEAREAIFSRKYDLIILDEINVAVSLDLIKAEEVAQAVRYRPPCVTLVLTGRGAPPPIIALGDIATEMRCIRFSSTAGPGIEY